MPIVESSSWKTQVSVLHLCKILDNFEYLFIKNFAFSIYVKIIFEFVVVSFYTAVPKNFITTNFVFVP